MKRYNLAIQYSQSNLLTKTYLFKKKKSFTDFPSDSVKMFCVKPNHVQNNELKLL